MSSTAFSDSVVGMAGGALCNISATSLIIGWARFNRRHETRLSGLLATNGTLHIFPDLEVFN
jgi:hypothetical protein